MASAYTQEEPHSDLNVHFVILERYTTTLIDGAESGGYKILVFAPRGMCGQSASDVWRTCSWSMRQLGLGLSIVKVLVG